MFHFLTLFLFPNEISEWFGKFVVYEDKYI